MKIPSICALALFVATVAVAPAAEKKLHKFTDLTGRTLVAAIQSIEDGKVIGLRKNGKTVKIPISSLSPEDVKYTEEWGRANFTVGLTFEPELTRSEVARVEHLVETTEYWVVNLALSNRTGLDLEDLTVGYAVATDHAERWRVAGSSAESLKEIGCHPGSVKLEKLPSSKTPTNVKTAELDILQAEQRRNPNIKTRLTLASFKQTDVITDVWVAIYDKYGKKLWEQYPEEEKTGAALKKEIAKLERRIVRDGERLAAKAGIESTPDTESL